MLFPDRFAELLDAIGCINPLVPARGTQQFRRWIRQSVRRQHHRDPDPAAAASGSAEGCDGQTGASSPAPARRASAAGRLSCGRKSGAPGAGWSPAVAPRAEAQGAPGAAMHSIRVDPSGRAGSGWLAGDHCQRHGGFCCINSVQLALRGIGKQDISEHHDGVIQASNDREKKELFIVALACVPRVHAKCGRATFSVSKTENLCPIRVIRRS